MELQFDPEDLEIGELEDLEDLGINIIGLDLSGQIPMKTLRAIAWIMARRQNPEMTFEDARKLKIKDLGEAQVTPRPNATGRRGGRRASSASSPSSPSSTTTRRKLSGV